MKLLIVKNNVTDELTLIKGVALAVENLASIGLNLEIRYYDLKKQLTSIPFSNSVNSNGYYADPMSYTGVWDIGYDLVCCVFDSTKITPSPTNPGDSMQSMSIPINWYMTYPEVLRDYLLHELTHYYFGVSNKKDRTHEYDPAFSQKQRYEWYLYLLKGLTTPETPPRSVLISRLGDNGIETLGSLVIGDNQFGCSTLELAWKDNQKNISCIPKGTYNCKWSFMFSELAYHYQIMNVPNRSGLFFHAGNFFFNSKGCIILGSLPQDINYDGQNDLIHSKEILSSFEKFMNKQPFTLTIQ